MKLRKILSNNTETKEYLNTLPKIYLVACWAKWGVLDFPFTGKFKNDKFRAHKKVPLVYQYDDHNGTDDSYYLRPITYTTTGAIDSWTLDRDEAYRRAKEKNRIKNEVKIEQENEVKNMKCIRCGKEMRNTLGGNYICDNCGLEINDLVYRGYKNNSTVIENPNYYFDAPRGWICPKCGAVLSPSTTFCPFCASGNNTTDKTTYDIDWVHRGSISGINSGQYVNPNTNTTTSKGE